MEVSEFLERCRPPGRVLFAGVIGSRGYNTARPDSDTDFAGVYVCPTRDILAVREQDEDGVPEAWHHDTGDILDDHRGESTPDYDFHEVGHFATLLLKGNPNLISLLWVDRLCAVTPEWARLVLHRDKFLTQEAVKQYLGYMIGQYRRLVAHDGHAGLHTTGGAYSEKWAYHILRLASDARRISRGQGPVVWKDGAERGLLMRVRNNEFEWQQVRDMLQSAICDCVRSEARIPGYADKACYNQWLDAAYANVAELPIPEKADKGVLNEWLQTIRLENW